MIAILAVITVTIVLSAIYLIPRPAPAGFYPYFFPFGGIFALFWIFAIFWFVRWLIWPSWGWGYRRRYWRYRDDSYYIIRERYARGEITKDQYEQMMRDLEQHN